MILKNQTDFISQLVLNVIELEVLKYFKLITKTEIKKSYRLKKNTQQNYKLY